MKRILAASVLAASFLLVSSEVVFAQSNIGVTPSTETMEKGKLYVESDLIFTPRGYGSGGYTVSGPRTIYGIGASTEVGANLFVTRASEPAPAELQFNFKHRLLKTESGFSVAAGAVLATPAWNRSWGGDTFASLYAVGSKQVGEKGPQLTAGVFRLVGRDAETGSQGGFTFGIVQAVHTRVLLVADRMTGNQTHGGHSATTAGAIVLPTANSNIGFVYSASNTALSQGGFLVWYGINF